LERMLGELEEVATVERPPILEGRNMVMVMIPKH
jgi:translation initiation factor IF-3